MKHFLQGIILISLILLVDVGRSVDLQINYRDGTRIVIPIAKIDKITFNGISTISQNSKLNQEIIRSFLLFQNYPNPFNPSTTIQFDIPQGGLVILKIFNLKGQIIRSIARSFPNAGSYLINWDGTNEDSEKVAAGMYVYQVQFAEIILTRKMILIK